MVKNHRKKLIRISEELRNLIDHSPSEEEIHKFFKDKIFSIDNDNPRISAFSIQGNISKFPITPDRIPDFISVSLKIVQIQEPSRMTFIELKKPDSPLYTTHCRMSKDLNNAWMECVENVRLLANNFRDCLRRITKELDKKHHKKFEKCYSVISEYEVQNEKEYGRFPYDSNMPWCKSVIVIGRRSTLDNEGLIRTRELSASTGRSIQVLTYDAIIDWLSEIEKNERDILMSSPYW